MKCSNCGKDRDLHCTIHVIPCCPGKCGGKGSLLTIKSKDEKWKQGYAAVVVHLPDDFWGTPPETVNCKCLPTVPGEPDSVVRHAFYIDLIADDPISAPRPFELEVLLDMFVGGTSPVLPQFRPEPVGVMNAKL